MDTPPPSPTPDTPPAGRLRGRRLVAGLLVSAAAVVLTTLAAAGFAVTDLARENSERSALQRASATAKTLAPAATELLKASELSALRRLLPELLRENDLEEIALTLPDGQVIAHSEPARITLTRLPDSWTAASIDESLVGGPESFSQAITIPGRGGLILNVRPKTPSTAIDSATLVTFGGIAAASLLALLALYRRSARPLSTLSMISTALADSDKCSGDLSLLTLDDRMGPEAIAWNNLLGHVQLGRLTAATASGGERLSERADGSPTRPLDSTDLEQAVNILPTGVIIIDRVGQVQHLNNMGAMLTGTTREQGTGNRLQDLLPGEDMEQFCASLASGTIPRRMLELKRQNGSGESILRIHCRQLRKDDGGAALILVEDITQQRTADASRNLFIAQATHELRTPLTNMRLALEQLTDDSSQDLPTEATEHVNMLQTEVRRLERIVSDMLAVSEIEAGSMKLVRSEVKLDRLMAEIEQDHGQVAAKKGIDLKVELPPKLPMLVGDREKLAQAMHNLVGNAVKYTPSGGTIRIIVTEPDTGGVSFAVTDTGMGISKEDQPRLFNRFVRANDPRVAAITGTGLGLALSKEIARLHGGDVTLESELNKGSTFTLSVPGSRQNDRRAA